VASISTAIASPTPSPFVSTERSIGKIANTNTPTVTIAGLAYHADPRSQRADFS
jgi:hypothetical protein